ncbi:MAG: polysaccharide pyruvyl transferase family protein, partial [Fibrobacter sp.]|nr:polysaccharide pyruvyl transferase family protein [Fibrobacter sp.]
VYLKIYKPNLHNKLKIREGRFNEFISTKLVTSKPFEGRDDLVEGAENYAAFILGSDQVLHPNNLRMAYFNMIFVPDSIPKITYAPSFGVTKIPESQKTETIKYLKRIDAISVREQTGRDIVFNLTGRDVPVVCDPTILIGKEDWDGIKAEKRIVEQKYILCYYLGKNIVHRQFANNLKKHTGLQIVTLPFMDEYVACDASFGDVALFDTGPSEFINLISNAEYVLTDSFHATVFSIIYSKIFFTFDRFEESEKTSTNSRISSLFNLLNIKGRKIMGNEPIEDVLNYPIDFEGIHKKMGEFREKSERYLLDAIEKNVCKEQ